jgi:hypothetical protein
MSVSPSVQHKADSSEVAVSNSTEIGRQYRHGRKPWPRFEYLLCLTGRVRANEQKNRHLYILLVSEESRFRIQREFINERKCVCFGAAEIRFGPPSEGGQAEKCLQSVGKAGCLLQGELFWSGRVSLCTRHTVIQFALEQALKAQRGSRSMVILCL